ncbi:MAG: hypothetical protein FJY65_02440 [Calditrichaeota bacterium]|nr:hypothetical protein [Calditrichota bacterium]
MRPFYESDGASKPKRYFADYQVNNLSGVEWWFKMGNRMGHFLPFLISTSSVCHSPFMSIGL